MSQQENEFMKLQTHLSAAEILTMSTVPPPHAYLPAGPDALLLMQPRYMTPRLFSV